ncbi:hypothetical protein [Streptomyces sp. NBC_01190]|uniref:hypothetical protein n=1 Tax=Streptomyces sp. NBC_01190 TaxID=2903767 RepID=UPI0038643DEA|nr:hypothetical protein OG519_00490 [Streptomyces sp. NBC_01190]
MALTGPAAASPFDGGTWVETSTGQVAVLSLAQPSPPVTWAGGADVVTDQGGTTTPSPAAPS